MANAKCCDRCGMLYMNKDHAGKLVNRVVKVKNDRAINWLDLCPECQEKLDKFMKMEEGSHED